MNNIISIFFDRHLKLQVHRDNKSAEGAEHDLLYRWTDDHWYDLLSLLGERYVLCGYYDEWSYLFIENKIFDQTRNVYLDLQQKAELLKGHRYIGTLP